MPVKPWRWLTTSSPILPLRPLWQQTTVLRRLSGLAELIFSEEQNHVQNILLEAIIGLATVLLKVYFHSSSLLAVRWPRPCSNAKSALESIVGKETQTYHSCVATTYGVAKAADTLLEKDLTDQDSIDGLNSPLCSHSEYKTAMMITTRCLPGEPSLEGVSKS